MPGPAHDTVPFPISDNHKRVLLNSGFDYRYPHVRFKPHNHAVEMVLGQTARVQSHDARADLLLKAKEAARDELERFLKPLMACIGCFVLGTAALGQSLTALPNPEWMNLRLGQESHQPPLPQLRPEYPPQAEIIDNQPVVEIIPHSWRYDLPELVQFSVVSITPHSWRYRGFEEKLPDVGSNGDPATIQSDELPAIEPAKFIDQLPAAAIVLFGFLALVLLWRINVNTRRTYLILNTKPQPSEQIEPIPSMDHKTKVHCSWVVEGETRKGQIRSENQDALALGETADGFKFQIVCDGAGGHAGGREASQLASRTLATFLTGLDAAHFTDKRECLELAIEAARQKLTQQECKGITTAIVCLFEGFYVHYATLGDGGLSMLWPDGMVQNLLVEHHALDQPKNVITAYIGQGCDEPPRIGTVRMEAGAILFSMSDGVSDLLDVSALANDRMALGRQITAASGSITIALLDQIEQARNPDTGAYLHSDNLTLSLAHLPRED